MNNKNNTKSINKLFILIPFFLIITLIIFDTIISYSENKKFKNTTESIIKEVINREDLEEDEYYNAIKRSYELKGYETDMLVVDVDYDGIHVENEYNYFGIFSALKTYHINTEDVKVLGITFKKITSLKKIEYKYTDIKILGVTFKARRSSKAFVKLTAKQNYDGEYEFIYDE